MLLAGYSTPAFSGEDNSKSFGICQPSFLGTIDLTKYVGFSESYPSLPPVDVGKHPEKPG
jgi:hypothetical protein